MALGLNIDSGGGSGGAFTPVVKYDARAGRIFRVDRENTDGSWDTKNVEVTNGFAAVMDLENIEVGWALFQAGVMPSLSMVKMGNALPDKPSDKHKHGFRLQMKLGKSSGGDVREMAATAKCVLAAMDTLHTEYEQGRAANPGKLPVVSLDSTTAIVSEGKDKDGNKQSSTNYQPVWKIDKWVDRPAELGGKGGEAKEEPKPEPVKEAPKVDSGNEEF